MFTRAFSFGNTRATLRAMKNFLKTISGDPISRFCFGAMQFGGAADETASQNMFETCRDAGINFFDTAFVYTDGRSESLLGGFAAPQRDRLLIATKCASSGGAGKANILAQFDQSRKRLNTDYVDILYLHQWDADTPLQETFETLAGLIQAGKTRYLAVSNYAAWQVVKAQNVARSCGVDISMIQPMYNLVKRQAEVEILPMALSQGIAVCPYSPLGGGLLTGKYARGKSGRIKADKRYASRYGARWMHDTAGELAALADEIGAHPATLAVAWVAQNPAITAPIISARNATQLAPSLKAMSFAMGTALYQRISSLSQRPAPATDRSENQ